MNTDHLTYSSPSNCPSIYEPLISDQSKVSNHHFSTPQFDQNNLLDPSSASKLTNKDGNYVHSIFQPTPGLLKPPCSNDKTSKTPNLSTGGTSNRLNLMGSSNLNLKADLTPTNLRRRCIAKNGVANIRNAKISRKNQRFFLDFFNTMIVCNLPAVTRGQSL